MVLTTVDHLNQAKAEATDSERFRCAIKTEEETGTDTVTDTEGGANTSTTEGEISIGSALLSNVNADSSSMAFGSGKADFGDSGSITVASSSNAHQQAVSIAMASASIKTRVMMPRRSKRISKVLCDQAMINPDSSAGIRTKDMDNSTETGVTRKRNAEDSSLKSRKKGRAARTERFEGRCKQLIDFIDDFGHHCHVPCRYSVNPSLGYWCGKMRCAYNQIQQGKAPKFDLTPHQIARLEEIGFKWKVERNVAMSLFEQRYHALEAFKSKFGRCNVSRKYSADPSLGGWRNAMRCAYKKIQQGQTPKRNLTQDEIERLEVIGFKWKLK